MGNVRKGISLVALIITIVVLIILTGAVMLTMNQGNIIGKSKEAVFKSDMANFKEELRNNILQAQLNGTISSKDDVNKTVWNEIKDWIPSATEKYNGKLSISSGVLKYIGDDSNELEWSAQIDIKTKNTPLTESEYNTQYATQIEIANTYGQVDSNGVYTLKEEYSVNEGGQFPGEITSIAIPYGTKTIGNYVFYDIEWLTSITIPNSVETIGEEAFFACWSLENITIPNSVETIGGGAFYNCQSLINVTIPNSVETIGAYAFTSCWSLTSITIPNSVETIGRGAFSDCVDLTSVTIPDEVTTIEPETFMGCESLISVTIPNSVQTIGANAFSYCTGLESVVIDNSEGSVNIDSTVFSNSEFDEGDIVYLR